MSIAKVQITVEVEVGNWGPDCSLKQVWSQAEETAKARVGRMIREFPGVQIVGPARVTTVLADDNQK